jgi:hypothetical protein
MAGHPAIETPLSDTNRRSRGQKIEGTEDRGDRIEGTVFRSAATIGRKGQNGVRMLRRVSGGEPVQKAHRLGAGGRHGFVTGCQSPSSVCRKKISSCTFPKDSSKAATCSSFFPENLPRWPNEVPRWPRKWRKAGQNRPRRPRWPRFLPTPPAIFRQAWRAGGTFWLVRKIKICQSAVPGAGAPAKDGASHLAGCLAP